MGIPSGYVNSLLLKMAIYGEFSHETWWFSIAMLNYQRVTDDSLQISNWDDNMILCVMIDVWCM